jgi:uncharacterized membrane protein YhaH (DUF805 family)
MPPLVIYSDFTPPAPRAEYWWYFLGIVVAYILLTIIESILGIGKMVVGIYGPLTILLWLGTMVPGIAVGIRRLHDTNRSGWWMLLMAPDMLVATFAALALRGGAGGLAALGTAGLLSLVGLACAIVLLVFMVLPGTPGENRYGPNPYGEGAEMVAAE